MQGFYKQAKTVDIATQKPEHKKYTKSQQKEPVAESKQTDTRSRVLGQSPRQRANANFANKGGPRVFRSGSVDGHERVKLPECKGSSSDSGESTGSLLCSLAPKWLSSHARHRRNGRRRGVESAPSSPPSAAESNETGTGHVYYGNYLDTCVAHSHLRCSNLAGGNAGSWSVTVAGSCRAALPADVEMRLRFPHRLRVSPHHASKVYQVHTVESDLPY